MKKTDNLWEADGTVVAVLFVLGLAISLWMISRVWVAFDASCMLARGWLLIQKGVWVPLGNPASGGGYVPGGLTAVMVGLPLGIWMDHRAPILLILVSHVAAYLLLDRLVKQTLDSEARIVFAVFYWLNPWRLYQSAWLDNSNYSFFVGAVHLWACFRQRHRPSFLHSFLLVAVVGLSVQLHLNALLAVFAALFLWWRGYWKVQWAGALLGAAVTIGSVVPFLLLAARHPEVIPINRDPIGLSLIRFSPLIKGVVYWFRYASLFCSSQSMYAFDFTRSFGPLFSAALFRLSGLLGLGLGSLTIALPVLANAWCWRRRRKTRRASVRPERVDRRAWFREYSLWCFVACVVTNALSPAPAMWWHNLIVLQAAVLPVLLWVDALLRTGRAVAVRRGLAAYAVLSVLLLVGVTVGSEQYRYRGGVPAEPPPGTNIELRLDLPVVPYNAESFPRRQQFFYPTYMRPFEIPPAGNPDVAIEPGAEAAPQGGD